MQNAPRLSRRHLIASSAAALSVGLSGVPAATQTATVQVANTLAALAGVDVLPRDLLRNLEKALGADVMALLQRDEPLPEAVRIRVLTALYSGILPAPDPEATGTRIGFSTALMWTAIDRTNNVISYCGGVPHFWADPPQQV
jgi:hypothetical protein